MKQILRLTLVCLMALFCGTTFAQDAYKTLTFPDDNSANNKISAYNKEWTAMSGGDSWTINCFNNNNWDGWSYIRCGWRTDATVASIATDFAIDQPIANVVVTFDKLSSTDKINSIYLVVASDAGFNDVVETVQAPNMTAGDMTFAVTAPTANCYYKLVVDCQKMSGSSGVVQISKLAYYKSGDEPVIVDISNTPETAYTVAKAHELIAKECPYPLHVGITESGTVYSGNVKSSVGLGIILHEGIGNTIRVSLTGDPAEEIRTAKLILKTLGLRKGGIEVVSCPTCGRTKIDLIGLANQVEKMVEDIPLDIKVAVMGCVVNGPGEAKEADIGIAGGIGEGLLIKKGEIIRKVKEDELLETLRQELLHWND